jgi:mRNA-degrading endonuclease RelE of RelBE toxin-antitoxin system
MNVVSSKTFLKQAKLLPKDYRLTIDDYITIMLEAKNLTELPFVEKLQGRKTYYKIRIGYLRIGLHVTDNTINLDCVLPRGDIYKTYPPQN